MAQPNPEPLPNPWADQRTALSPRQREGSVTQYQYYYTDVDGTLERATSETRPSAARVVAASCCPCAVPPAPGRGAQRWVNLLCTFCFWATVAQLALLIASIALHGFASYSDNPLLGGTPRALIRLGAKYAPLIVHRREVWRLWVSMWLHAGIVHLALNAWAQLRFGVALERRYAWWRIAIVWVVTGVGAAIASCVLTPGSISVGASGAIAGLMGVSAVEIFLRWDEMEQNYRKNAAIQSLVAIALLIGLGFLPLVDAGAHAGGLIVGILMGAAYFGPTSTSIKWPVVQRGLPWCALFGIVVYFVVGFVLVFAVVHVKDLTSEDDGY
eukprot:m51a1_g8987 putative rhomboid-like protein 6 (327) ;mRNA; f:63016-64384